MTEEKLSDLEKMFTEICKTEKAKRKTNVFVCLFFVFLKQNIKTVGLSSGSEIKKTRRHGFDPCVRKIP